MESFSVERTSDANGEVTATMTIHVERFDAQTFEALRKAALKLNDSPPRIIIVVAKGPDFCLGLDLSSSSTLHEKLTLLAKKNDAYRAVEIIEHLRRCINSLSQIPVPIIVAAEGACNGPGAALAFGSDVLVISDTTSVGFPAVSKGLMDGLGGLSRVLSQTGPTLGIEMALSGRRLSAMDLMELGYASDCVAAGEGLARARQIAQEMMAQTGPHTRREILMGIRGVRRLQSKPYEERTLQTAARTIVSGEFIERLNKA